MNPNEQAFSVTQLNEYVKMLIDSDEILQTAAVCGEISNFKHHYATGHLYFTLKDERSSVKCVMFARDAARLKFEPENGMTVTAWGRVSVFPRDGAYQFYVGFMSPSGLGEQFYVFEMLKQKLASEGLFDAARKKMIPKFPKKIGIITSPTGAAVRDLYNVLTRRWPIVEIELFPALVQGTGAASSLRKGIEYFDSKDDIDVVIIGRGGGSGEDLSAFNDEALARTVAASTIPVISAVGHEIDYTICDFVSDLRVPTPSAAAELVVGGQEELINRVTIAQRHMNQTLQLRLSNAKNHLANLLRSSLFHEPKRLIEVRSMQIDELEMRMENILNNRLTVAKNKLANLENNLRHLNPKNILERGYTMVFDHDGKPVTSAQLNEGSLLELHFADGIVDVKVEHAEKFEAQL